MRIRSVASLDFDVDIDPYLRLGVRPDPTRCGTPSVRVGQGPQAVHVRFHPPVDGVPNAGRADDRPLRVTLRVSDLRAAIAPVVAGGLTDYPPRGSQCTLLAIADDAGTDIYMIDAPAAVAVDPLWAFPLKRLDHLAAVTHDIDDKCRFWEEVLGVPVAGEVRTPTMIIRQLKIGDAIFELLGPAGPDSPIHQRPAGLVRMAAWEVDDLPAAVALARSAGFTVSDPATGILPGTRTATIPAAELGGVAMQLLQYG
jgi:catechol 2,3-dioxygenase-like lactoylglutathione lyase family enzyme